MTRTETEMTRKGYEIHQTFDTRAEAVEEADFIRRCADGQDADVRKCADGWNVWVEAAKEGE